MNSIRLEKIKNESRFIIPQNIPNTSYKCWVNNDKEFQNFDREKFLKRQASYQIQLDMIKSIQERCQLQYNFLLISLIDEEIYSIQYQVKSQQKLIKIEDDLNKFQQQFNKELNILHKSFQQTFDVLRINNLQLKLIDIQNLLNKYQAKKLLIIKNDEIDNIEGQQQDIYCYEYYNNRKILNILIQIQQTNEVYENENDQNLQEYLMRILEKHILKINQSAKQYFKDK